MQIYNAQVLKTDPPQWWQASHTEWYKYRALIRILENNIDIQHAMLIIINDNANITDIDNKQIPNDCDVICVGTLDKLDAIYVNAGHIKTVLSKLYENNSFSFSGLVVYYLDIVFRSLIKRKKYTVATKPIDIIVCTPDINSIMFSEFMRSLDNTTNIQHTLRIFSNSGVAFSHPANINYALNSSDGYIVICDDDIRFTDGWLEAGIEAIESSDDIGVVGYTLYNIDGSLFSSAMYYDGKELLLHEKQYDHNIDVPTQCSACWIIAPTRLRMDERYKKYFFEFDFNFRLWEHNKRTVVIPHKIYHIRRGQMAQLSGSQYYKSDDWSDVRLFMSSWVNSGRLHKLYNRINNSVSFELPKRKLATIAKKAIVTIACGDCEYFKHTLPLMHRYARKVNADFVVIDDKWLLDEQFPHLLKFRVPSLFDRGYDRICYIDADILCTPCADNVFDATKRGSVWMFDETEILTQFGVDRAKDLNYFLHKYNEFLRSKGLEQIENPNFTGYYNTGVIVCDADNHPFIKPIDNVVTFDGCRTFDYEQTYINLMACARKVKISPLPPSFNRMAICKNNSDMLTSTSFAHYCGDAKYKQRLFQDVLKIVPTPVERPHGDMLDGLYEWWMATSNIDTMVEVGSAHGESAWVWTEMNPNLQLWCIDPYDTTRYGPKAEGDFDIRHSWNKNVKKLKTTSVEAAKFFRDGSLDAVYIDAMHEYKDVIQDITTWLSKIRHGGWIGGHDYSTIWPGCVRAVNEIFGSPFMVFRDSSWLVKI